MARHELWIKNTKSKLSRVPTIQREASQAIWQFAIAKNTKSQLCRFIFMFCVKKVANLLAYETI